MAVAANIDIALSANTSKLSRGLSLGISKITSFSASVRAAANGMAPLGGAFGKMLGPLTAMAAGFLSVNKAISAFNESRERLDAFAKTMDKLGLSADELTAVTHAAAGAGVGMEELEAALFRLQRAGVEAVNGNAKLNDAFDQLGINVQEFASSSADEKLAMIADGMSKIESPAIRAALASAIFGKSAADLLPLLNQGGDSIRNASERAKELRGSLSDFDLSAVEAMNDSISEVGISMSSITDKLVASMAPTIKTIADMLTDWNVNTRDTMGSTSELGDMFAQIGGIGMSVIDALHGGWLGFKGLVGGVLGFIAKGIAFQIDMVDALIQRFADVLRVIPGMEDIADSIEDVSSQVKAGAEAFADELLKNSWDDLVSGGEKVDDSLSGRTFDDFMKRVKKTREEMEQELNKPVDNMAGIGDTTGAGGWLVDKLKGAASGFGGFLGDSIKNLSDSSLGKFVSDSIESINQAIGAGQEQMQDIGAPGSAERGSEQAFDIMASIQRQEQQTQIQQLAIQKQQADLLKQILNNMAKGVGLLPAAI